MKLIRLGYSQFVGNPQEWSIEDCTFDDINLIVGKNATGKTRTLNVIRGLADLLSEREQLRWSEGIYNVEFQHERKVISYILEYHQRSITAESLSIDSEVCLQRGADGSGHIYASELHRTIGFKVSVDQVAAAAKRDALQHPFLEDLYKWGKGLIRYDFGTPLGHDHYAIVRGAEPGENGDSDLDVRETRKVVSFFIKGHKEFGTDFNEAIIDDMASIGYQIEDIGAEPMQDVTLSPNIPARPLELYVKEMDRAARTYQHEMSQGMFRALSILTQISYSFLRGEPSCILIDDIGEGLDYIRSTSLIKRMIEKIRNSGTQLIMATNDRFIMNNVPLEYWIILERQGERCIHHNYRNSKSMFDEFELTGLSNFDLFSTDYYLRDFADNEKNRSLH